MNGLETGARNDYGLHDEGLLLMSDGAALLPDRFVYRTVRNPWNLTHGKSSVPISPRSAGFVNSYAAGSFNDKQERMHATTVGSTWRTLTSAPNRTSSANHEAPSRKLASQPLGLHGLSHYVAEDGQRPGGRPARRRSRQDGVREFGKYLQLAGVDAFIVPCAWIATPVRGLPHMFTEQELAAFFRAADSIAANRLFPALLE